MICSSSNTRRTPHIFFVYKVRPERTGFNMYSGYTRLQLTFLALVPCKTETSTQKSRKKFVLFLFDGACHIDCGVPYEEIKFNRNLFSSKIWFPLYSLKY